jgi:phospholipid transport system substrate-binding protein
MIVLRAMLALTTVAAMLPASAPSGAVGTGSETVESAESAPAEVVARLQAALLSAMKDGATAEYAERRDHLRPVITSTHDLDFVAHTVLRRYWKQLDDTERSRFTATFRELCVGTYADKFDSFTGQRFEPGAERKLKRGSMLVQTKLYRPDKDAVQLDYVLIKPDDRWLIVNVVADGVSDLAVKRAEYGSIMEKDGFEELLARLEEKIASLPSE